MRIVSDAWRLSPASRVTRRLAIVMTFGVLLIAFGPEEAIARAVHGGIATAGGGGGGVATTLTPWTITEQSGSGQTTIPVEIYVPFSAVIDPVTGSAGACPFISTDAIQILDAGGAVLDCQEDNRSSDITAAADIRGVRVVAMLPAITANQARQLTVQKVSSTSPATGTDATTADIIATGFDCVLSMAHSNGTTYTASAATALAASTFTNKTTAANLGKWLSGGGLATQYILFCPYKNGATAAPDNMGAWFTVTAFKTGRGAVGGGNPIIGFKVQYWNEIGWAQVLSSSGIQNHYYDLSATCGAATQSWIGSSPAKTLTLSHNSAENNVSITVPAGGTTFTPNSVGMVIGDNTGQARIIVYNSATSVDAYLVNSMSGTTITSGNWRIYGINHQYASCMPMQEIWYSGAGVALTAKPNVDSTLGAVWNGGTLTGGPSDYFKSTRMILPYTTPASDITNDLTNINDQGTNPTGMGNSVAGDITLYLPTTGPRPEIAPLPGWYAGAMIRADANSKTKIFANALKWTLIPIHWRDQTTGKVMLLDNGTNYFYDRDFGSPALPSTGYHGGQNVKRLNTFVPQVAHHPNLLYGPWLYTGDFYWVDKMQQMLFWLWADSPTSFGSQLNRLAGNCDEPRGNGWTHRDMTQGLMMIPNRDPDVLGWNRAHLRTWYDNHYTATNSGTAGVSPYPGLNIGCVNNTGPGKVYSTAGIRHWGQGLGGNVSLWQVEYGMMAFFMSKGMGMLSTDSDAFLTWLSEGITGAALNTTIANNWMISSYYMSTREPNFGAAVSSWYDVSRVTSDEISESGQNRRLIAAAGTLSGLSGSVTVTMPAGYFDAGGTTFYNNGVFRDLNAASLQVLPAIVAGGTGYAVNDTINVTFTGLAGVFTQSRTAQLKVTSVSGGVITGITINDAGLYIAVTAGDYGGLSNTITQVSTSGSGTGASFGGNSAPDTDFPWLMRFGTAFITGVNAGTHVLTMTTSGSFASQNRTVYAYPFAQTSLVSSKYVVPAPARGDNDGTTGYPGVYAIPLPYNGYYEFWELATSVCFMCDLYGLPNGAAAKSYCITNYAGGGELKWKVY